MAEQATAEGPARRRPSWNLRNIVEDVAGRPIEDLQDPDRPVHPYLRNPPTVGTRRVAPNAEEEVDRVGRVYPPLVGRTGREYHGPANEHDAETLERHRIFPDVRATSPFRRPERLYLHYLLLHLDRLSDSAIHYLRTALEEELAHRAEGLPTPAPAPPRLTPPDP